MKSTLTIAAGLLAMAAATAHAQQPNPAPNKATFISKEEVDRVNATAGTDRNIKVADIGRENFAVGVIHRGKTVDGKEAGAQKIAAVPGQPPPAACGRKDEGRPGGVAGGITHDVQTEAYYIVSGGGTMYTDGYLTTGRHLPLPELNGPTCIGLAYDVVKRIVKPGDIVIIPAGVVHGWLDVPDHVDYLSFRPSPGVLAAGWVNPAIAH